MKKDTLRAARTTLICFGIVALSACTSLKTPATADVAVSKEAVTSAAEAGAGQYAPMELHSAREKLAAANKAMAAEDYKLARTLAAQAQADADLAKNKANSAKATAAADALKEDVRVLREELDRAGSKP